METGKVTTGLSSEQIIELRKKKKEGLEAGQIKALQESMSIRERLERKLQTDVVSLELEDDLGKFTLRFRKLTPLENDNLVKLQNELKVAGTDAAKSKEIVDKMYDVLGSLSLDALDAEYWKAGIGYSPDVLLSAVLKVMSASTFPNEKYLGELIKFRTQ